MSYFLCSISTMVRRRARNSPVKLGEPGTVSAMVIILRLFLGKRASGLRFNIKAIFPVIRISIRWYHSESHCEYMTVSRPSYLYNGNTYNDKTESLYRNRPSYYQNIVSDNLIQPIKNLFCDEYPNWLNCYVLFVCLFFRINKKIYCWDRAV